MKTLSAGLLEEITERLVAEFHPEQVILFGSHAWGTPDKDSDIDLLVIVSASDERPIQRAQRAHRCLRDLNVAKDILVKTRAEVEWFRPVRASLTSKILRRGKVLYGPSFRILRQNLLAVGRTFLSAKEFRQTGMSAPRVLSSSP
jgi:predicted nucleotidyltransferase